MYQNMEGTEKNGIWTASVRKNSNKSVAGIWNMAMFASATMKMAATSHIGQKLSFYCF